MTRLTLDPTHPIARSATFLGWLDDEGIAADDTYKVAIRGHRVKVWQFDRNADGRKYVDPATAEIAKREPFVVHVAAVPDFGVCRSGKRGYTLRSRPAGRAAYPCALCRSWHLGLPVWMRRLLRRP